MWAWEIKLLFGRYQCVCVPHTQHLQNLEQLFWLWFWETLRAWRSSISLVSHSGYVVRGRSSLVCRREQKQREAETYVFAEIFQTHPYFPATGASPSLSPAWLPASLGATSWITQVWFQGSAFLADDFRYHPKVTDLLSSAQKGDFIQQHNVIPFKTVAKTSSITLSCLFNSLYYLMFY